MIKYEEDHGILYKISKLNGKKVLKDSLGELQDQQKQITLMASVLKRYVNGEVSMGIDAEADHLIAQVIKG